MKKYILKGRKPVPCEDVLTWARWFETADRRVAWTERDGDAVSTVFLGVDHNFFGGGPPLLFETMVFRGDAPFDAERYSTWDEAEAGHRRWVAKVWPPVEYVH